MVDKVTGTGTRAQVWHGTKRATAGGLTRSQLMMHKGRIVSRKAHAAGKKAIKRLRALGYVAKKGTFRLFRKGNAKMSMSRKSSSRKRRSTRRRRGGYYETAPPAAASTSGGTAADAMKSAADAVSKMMGTTGTTGNTAPTGAVAPTNPASNEKYAQPK
jgi:hypothetical protein